MVIGIDFDGVLHAYSQGWQGGTIYDIPIEGAFAALKLLISQGHSLFIFTAREDLKAVALWMEAEGGFSCEIDDGTDRFWHSGLGVILVTNRKIPADIYLDDRAVRFHSWQQALGEINLITMAVPKR